MRKWFGGLFITGLIAALAMFSYQVSLEVMRVAAVERYQKDVFAPELYPPQPAALSTLIDELSNKARILGGDELKLMRFDLLCLYAWYYPDEAAATLQVALPLGEELYRSFPENHQYIGERLVSCYVYAALPEQVERWLDETSREPVLRPHVLYDSAWALILKDDIAGAAELINEELTRFPSVQSRAFALVGYTILGEYELAGTYAQAWMGEDYIPQVYDYVYLQYLVQQAQFAQALSHMQQLQQARENPRLDADDALMMLIACAGAKGWQDPQCKALLARAAQSTRRPTTPAGVKARALAGLYAATGDASHLQALDQVAAANPADYNVCAAKAVALLEGSASGAAGVDLAELRKACDAALQLAHTPVHLQDAYLLAGRASCVNTASAASTRRALDCLAAALGDSQAQHAVHTQRVAEYESFLLDQHVRKLRAADPAFDAAVHDLILGYLARRQALFAEFLKPPGLDS